MCVHEPAVNTTAHRGYARADIHTNAPEGGGAAVAAPGVHSVGLGGVGIRERRPQCYINLSEGQAILQCSWLLSERKPRIFDKIWS